LILDQFADAVGVVGLVGQHEGAWTKTVEQRVGDLPVMRLPRRSGRAELGAPRIDDDMDLGREPVARSPETVICTPLFAVADCWWARTEVLSIIWMSPSCAAVMASISRSHTPAFRHRAKRL
jgi:hypothetical protein